MDEVPVTGAIAEYRGRRLRIVFSDDDGVALSATPGPDVPDAIASGRRAVRLHHYETWVKVPRSALDGVLHLQVTGTINGHEVTLGAQLPDGRVVVWFLGPPAVAKALELDGDQYMGWTGMFTPDWFDTIRVEETRMS